jgi:hypothetical protein
MLFLSMRRGRKVTFPLQGLVARGSSSSSCLEVSHHGRALHGGEIPPLLLPTWRRFLQAAAERKSPSPCRLKPDSCGIVVVAGGPVVWDQRMASIVVDC